MYSLEHYRKEYPFPSFDTWPSDAPLAWGGELFPGRLLSSYSQGIFPWYSEQKPILWWSPDPRCVLFLDQLKISHSLSRELKKKTWTLRADIQFHKVIEACSKTPRPRQAGTWLTDKMIDAYNTLHQMGLAHSIEVYLNEKLVGGLYGLSLGNIFFGESMFSTTPNASKIALIYLVRLLKSWQYTLIDCQVHNPHLASLGAQNIPRTDFLQHLNTALSHPSHQGPWTHHLENLLHPNS